MVKLRGGVVEIRPVGKNRLLDLATVDVGVGIVEIQIAQPAGAEGTVFEGEVGDLGGVNAVLGVLDHCMVDDALRRRVLILRAV